jgi:hypothetical protein
MKRGEIHLLSRAMVLQMAPAIEVDRQVPCQPHMKI